MIFGSGYNNGDVAEDFFYNGFSATTQTGAVHYDFIDRILSVAGNISKVKILTLRCLDDI